MSGSVARLPSGDMDGNGHLPPADIYKAAVEEYRFQAQFNWSRTQYMLAFNAAILAAATAVASRPGHGASLVFGLGCVTSVMSGFIVRTQSDYYRAARNRMRRVEIALHIPEDQRTDTTSTLGGRSRLISVTQIVYLLFGALTVADLVGVGLVLAR